MAFLSVAPASFSTTGSASPATEPPHRVLLVGAASKLIVATAQSSGAVSTSELVVSESPSAVMCGAVSPSNVHVAACSDNKALAVWRREEGGGADWAPLGARVLPKRAVVLCFTRDDKSLLVGDKTGEVHLYALDRWDAAGGHLLGHLSLLLDMVLSPSNSHVITCDRDEKIRVSKFPNSYNIESFCLGHSEFVSSINLCPKWPHLLVSGSGDGTVKVWEWREGRLVSSRQVGVVLEGSDEGGGGGEGQVQAAVTKVCCSRLQDTPLVVAMVERCSQLHCFGLSLEGVLSEWGVVQLPTTPWDVAFDWSDSLWVCLRSQPHPVMCFKQREGKFSEVLIEESAMLESLSRQEYFEGVGSGDGSRDWDQMRKHLVDNMGPYLARKEERLQAKKTKPAAISSNSPPPQDTNGTPDDGKTPPNKKHKADEHL